MFTCLNVYMLKQLNFAEIVIYMMKQPKSSQAITFGDRISPVEKCGKITTNKMAATSIASELLQNLDCFPYKVNIDDFGEDNHIDPEDLKRLRTSIRDQFWIDTRPFQTRRGNIIPTGVFSIFGKFNNTPPETVKNELQDWVEDR